jgi:hypothetical protein
MKNSPWYSQVEFTAISPVQVAPETRLNRWISFS